MPGYDTTVQPPAPIAEVVLRNPANGAELSVRMLIDTGADVTLIPRDAVKQIGCQATATHNLQGFDGDAGAYEEVFAEIVFLGESFKDQFLTLDQPTGFIGRNILNFVALTFDGPRVTWTEAKRQ